MGNTHGLCCVPSLSIIVMSLCLLLYICPANNFLTKLIDGREYYVGDNGMMFFMCPAGTFVSSDCETNLTSAHCESCPPETFSLSINRARSCKDCKHCGIGQFIVINCTAKSDTVCVCPDNMEEVPYVDKSGTHCVLKKDILPKADNLRTTAIVIPFLPCPDDQYRDNNGNCIPCPSTLQPHNVTFVDTPSVTNKVDVPDKNAPKEEWYKAKNGLTCRKCPKGHFVLSDCKVNSTAGQCQKCRTDTYYPCMSKHRSCIDCTHCGIGQKIKEQCTTISDTVCVCLDNLVEVRNTDGSGSYCVPKTDKSVNPQQSSSTAAPHHPECPSGMYRDISKNTDCLPCSNCLNVTHPCNGTHDAICASTQNTNGSDNKQGLIIGITVAAVVVIVIVVIIAVRCIKQKSGHLYKDEKWYKVLYSSIIKTNIEETAN